MAHDILVVDDEADIRMLIADILSDEGYATRQAANSDEVFAAVQKRMPSLVILDIWLQGSKLDGMQILEALKEQHPELPVIMISGHGTIDTAVSAIKIGAYDFIEKPFQADRLLVLIERAIETASLRQQVEDLTSRVGGEIELVGRSAAANQLRSTVEKVAPTGSRVLITGPAGAGKEVVARLLHRYSRRHTQPFVVLNCAAMAPDRMEIELFGTEEPDEDEQPRRVIGTFERAHAGTLLLDEVADMPLETQGKIVRVLQEQRFYRVGGDTQVEVDVRVLATTNRDLAAAIESGQFREDLYYRLNVVPIRVPPLAARREDIPEIARHLMRTIAQGMGMQEREFGDDAIAVLQAYDWPGNVRQLKNVIERMLIMAPGSGEEPIKADMLPQDISSMTPSVLQWDKSGEIMALPLREARETFERDYLIAQVNRFGGNISRTASFIGMERSALHRKLKALGVSSDDRTPAA
jgi:two-component system nitrogen regulation response regulator NtrX